MRKCNFRRPVRGLAVAGLAALLIVGCGGDGGESAGDEDAEVVEVIDEVDLPTQDQADEEAEAAIDDANADAEFEALKSEIEKDG